MSGLLSGNIVVVTGGAGRLGRSFCTAISREGGTAVVSDTASEAASAFAMDLCTKYGPSAAMPLPFDIRHVLEIDGAIEELHRRFGRIDGVINNAYPRNARYGAKFEDVTYDDFAENVASHLGGYFLTAQRFASYFIRQGHGNIINLGSIYGFVAPRFGIYSGTSMTMPVEYAAIKSGVIHLTRYLAQYFKANTIRVNCLSPGGVLDGQPRGFVEKYGDYSAGGKMLDPADLTGAMLFLLSSASTHITGQNIVVDDGWSL